MIEIHSRDRQETKPGRDRRPGRAKSGSDAHGTAESEFDYDREDVNPGRMFLIVGIAGALFWTVVGVALWLLWDLLFPLIELGMDEYLQGHVAKIGCRRATHAFA